MDTTIPSRSRFHAFWARPAVLWAAIFGGALALGVAGAVVLNQSSPPHPAEPFDEIAQSAVATDQGVTIEALGASYSGTETLLRLRVTVDNEQAVLTAVDRNGPVRRVIVGGTGYSGPFDHQPMSSTSNALGELLVQLPGLHVDGNYDGEVDLVITALVVQLDSGPAELKGAWPLALKGPASSSVREQLRVETFSIARTAISGAGEATITGFRSRSETRLAVTLPQGVLMLSQPVLRTNDARLAPRSFKAEGNEAQASFPPTPFGQVVILELGTLALTDDASAPTFVLSLADLLSEVGDAESFEVPASAIASRDATAVMGGEQGRYGRRPWAGLVLAGAWHPENGRPVITDARGTVLDLAHIQIGYQKDANGVIHEGSTAIAFFTDGGADLRTVTILLGSRSVVDSTPFLVTLEPSAE